MERHETLYALAPLTLTNFRQRRYHGDDLCLPLSAFVKSDRECLRALYAFLQELQAALTPREETADVSRVMEFLRAHPADALFELVGSLGRESYAGIPIPLMAKTIHDLRGGALTALFGQLEMAQIHPLQVSALNALYFLTRDHLKIMRNALLGLDDVKRNEDLQLKLHGTDLIMEKWNGACLHEHGRDIRLELDCPRAMPISECCVEFGALDRTLYNLINNACRHAASDCIRLVLLPVPDAEGKDLRFVLLNVVSPQELQNLRSLDLAALFQEGASTTGSGYGLAIVGDFISHAYGLQSIQEAIAGGYLGAAVIGDSFAVWFHWPRILED